MMEEVSRLVAAPDSSCLSSAKLLSPPVVRFRVGSMGYPAVSQADARRLRDRAKKALSDSFDPARHTNNATTTMTHLRP